MRAKDLPNLSKTKADLSDKAKQRLLDRAHEEALKMNAKWDQAQNAQRHDDKRRSNAEATCKKKQAFPNPDAAAKESAARVASGAVPLSAYLCRVCGQWHLTSKGIMQRGSAPRSSYLRRNNRLS